MKKRIRLTVHGKVQGVGFRFFVVSRARELKLDGLVRNNYTDSTVEVEAQGDEEELLKLLAIVRKGPAASAVSEVSVKWEEPLEGVSGFEISR